jgi:DNA ligase-1
MFAHFKDIATIEEVPTLLNESKNNNCEGLMLKSLELNSTYEPSKRSANWYKLKKDYVDSGLLCDSLDLVVVGADWGRGKRKGLFGSFLVACFDAEAERFQVVTKMATGLTDEDLTRMHSLFSPLIIDSAHSEVQYKVKNVDVWFTPKHVWEVKCADLTLSPVYLCAH